MSPKEVAKRFGWLRSVGSANPYLAVHARTGALRAEIERAVADVELVEIPAARGCTYYVAQEDAGIGLRLAAMGSGLAEFRMAERHLGVTDVEVGRLSERVFAALGEGPLDPRAIAVRVEPRSLGEAGKRRGMTNTLSLALSRLQLGGQIRRLPHGGRLDTERFRYARWEFGPCPAEIDEETLVWEVAARYFDWAGPATEKEFREWSGLSARLSKGAVTGLVPCPHDPTRLMRPEDLDGYAAVRPTEGRAVLVASLDPWLHLRRFAGGVVDREAVPREGIALTDLDSHPIALDGEVVGLWEFDHAAQAVAAWTWRPCEAIARAVEETGGWIVRDLGDFRAFSLDGPKSRVGKIERLRAAV